MSKLKVGDRVRLSTGVEGVVDRVNGFGGRFGVEFDGGYFNSDDLKALGVTWELLKPGLAEPSALTPIQFDCYKAENCVHLAFKGADGYWEVTGGSNRFDWEDVLDRFKPTEYEIVRPEKEVVQEVLKKVLAEDYLGSGDHYDAVKTVAEEYGVTL